MLMSANEMLGHSHTPAALGLNIVSEPPAETIFSIVSSTHNTSRSQQMLPRLITWVHMNSW